MSRRLLWLDAARGLAVVAMVIFHLIWDLAHFGYIERAIPWSAPVKAFGHSIAFSFLFIAGLSLALANREAMRWRPYWRRFAIIAGAAALVSAGTYAVFPNAWVFFGILHVIAAASLAALPFLRAPWPLTLAAGLVALAAPWLVSSTLFDANGLMWLGLGTREPMTQDWRPFFPWAGALLVGVAVGRLPLPVFGVKGKPHQQEYGASTEAPAPAKGRALAFLGRHSLIIYLAHQPLLFALFSALAFVAPGVDETTAFIGACEQRCVTEGGVQKTCHEACVCLATEAKRSSALANAKDDLAREQIMREIAKGCVLKD